MKYILSSHPLKRYRFIVCRIAIPVENIGGGVLNNFLTLKNSFINIKQIIYSPGTLRKPILLYVIRFDNQHFQWLNRMR